MKESMLHLSAVVICSIALISCGGGDSGDTGTDRSGTPSDGAETSTESDTGESGIEMVEKAGSDWGTVTGTVSFSGDTPDPVVAPRDSKCGIKQGDVLHRIKIDEEKKIVKNAVVYLDGLKKAIKGELPPQNITIDQKKCLFKPRWVYVTRTSGTITVKNSDPELHNFRYQGSSSFGAQGNKNQAAGAEPINVELNSSEWVDFRCNIHPWMIGLLRASEHHAVAITGEDGTFSFQVPPGQYTLKVNHPEIDDPKSVKVTVEKGKTSENEVELSFD